MYSVISKVLEVLFALFQGYCLQYFCRNFLECRLPESKWNSLLITGLYGLLKLGTNLVLPPAYESITIMERQVLNFIVLIAVTMCFYKAVHAITIFLLVTYMAVREISFFLAYMVLRLGNGFVDLWLWFMEKGYISSADTFVWLVEASMLLLQFLLYMIFALLLYFSVNKIVQSFREKDYGIHRTELLFILTPDLAGLMICTLLRMIIITVEDQVPKLLYDKYPLLMLIVPAILILSLLSILYGIRSFQDMICLNREKNGRIILEKQVTSMQEHIEEIERVYSGIRSMKHDMKNTLAVILQLAEGGEENIELQDYLSELNRTMDRLDFQFKTGNTVVDTLLNMKYHEAVRTMPELQMDTERLVFPQTLLIQSYDIGIILGNALDNAIEACRRFKDKEPEAELFIRLYSFQKGKMFFIEAENSFDGKVIRKRHAEFPVTDKDNKEAHGIGFSNMRKAAEKYHGAVDWSAHDHIFTLSVMMQNERRDENVF